MSAPAIFVSHSHKDDAYCREFVARLRGAGLDVWYDEHNASAGHLVDLIERELRQRPIFVVVLSPAALESKWVKDECTWAYGRWQKDPANRVILPVLAETVDEDDIWLFLQAFKRVEQPGLRPWPVAEAARRVALAIDPNTPVMPAESHAAPPPTAPDPSDEVDALLARANALASQGKRREAIEVLRRATTLAPRSVAAWNALGFNLDYILETSDALEAFERALLLEPNNAFAWAGKAGALANEHPQQGLSFAEKALDLDPRSAFGFTAKGVALSALGQSEKALDAYGHALAIDPTYSHIWWGKGYVLNSLGRYQKALDAYEHALTLDPELAVFWNGKGFALYGLDRYQEALDAYERALALDPNAAYAWSGKGNTLYRLRRYQEALDAYNRALALDPKLAITWQNKAYTLRELKRTREADEAERRAKDLEGKQ